MLKLNQRGAVQFLIPLILLAGIIGGVYLVQHTQIFKPKAAPTIPTTPETSFELELEKNAVSPFTDEATPQNIGIGTTFRADLYARSDIEAANLFAAKIKYSSDTVEFVEVNKRNGQSFIKEGVEEQVETRWVEVSVDNSNQSVGVVSMVGAVSNPGIKTDPKAGAMLMGSIIFKTKKLGTAKIELSDSSVIYSNANNINILTARKGLIEVPIQQPPPPSPSPTPLPFSCTSVNVDGGIQSKFPTGDTYYLVDSEAKVKFTVSGITPSDAKLEWKEVSRSMHLPAGKLELADANNTHVANYTVPINSRSDLQGVYVRADFVNSAPVKSCPTIHFVVKPVPQPSPSPSPSPSPTSNFRKAIKLDGQSYISASKPNDSQVNSYPCNFATLEMWVKMDRQNLGRAADIISKVGNFRGFDLATNGSGTLAFYMYGQQFFSNTSLVPGRWHHIAIVKNFDFPPKTNNGIYIYLDGKLDGFRRQPSSLDDFCQRSNGDLRIGRPSLGFIGEIDEVVFNSSIKYTQEFTPSTRPLTDGFLIYHFDGDLTDSGIYGFHGQPEGNVQFVDSTVGIVTPSPASSPSPSPSPQPGNGDGNKDGKVDLIDLSILLSDFNKTGIIRKDVDLNGDGKINTFDFSLMRNLLIQKGVIKG